MAQDVGDALVYFRIGLIRQGRIYNALVQTQLPAIRRDAQHIVLAGVHGAGMYFLRPLGQLLHQGLLVLGGLANDGVVLGLGYG